MSNYSKATNFTAKDSLTTGDPSKKVLGSEIDTELTAIETAIATKANTASPTFTGTVTLPAATATSLAATGTISTESTDAGATVGPNIELYRNSASPAASDIIGSVDLYGEDSAGNKQLYGRMYGFLENPTSTAEEGRIRIETITGGAVTLTAEFKAGQILGSPTGSFKGAGTINAASGVYDNGNRVHSASGEYNSGNQTITSAGALTLAHSLPAEPTRVTCWLKCTTGEHGFSIGDKVLAPLTSSDAATDTQGFSLVADATNLTIRFGTNPNVFTYKNKTTGAGVALTNASWAFIVVAQ